MKLSIKPKTRWIPSGEHMAVIKDAWIDETPDKNFKLVINFTVQVGSGTRELTHFIKLVPCMLDRLQMLSTAVDRDFVCEHTELPDIIRGCKLKLKVNHTPQGMRLWYLPISNSNHKETKV